MAPIPKEPVVSKLPMTREACGTFKRTFDLPLDDYVSTKFEVVLRSGELGNPKVELSFGFTVRW